MYDNTIELLDLILSQAIERYLEMKPAHVEKALIREWPPQMRTLIRHFIDKSTCRKCHTHIRFMLNIEAGKDSGYVVRLCQCKPNPRPKRARHS